MIYVSPLIHPVFFVFPFILSEIQFHLRWDCATMIFPFFRENEP